MVLTAIQIQSLIVLGVLALACAIVGAVAIKWEKEEERERLRRVRAEINRRY